MDRYMSTALDRHITGNWGENQFKGSDDFDEFVDKICSDCMCQEWCPTFEKFCNGDNYNPCLIIKAIMEMREAQEAEYERDADEHYALMEEEMLAEDAGTWVSDDANTNWENNYLQFARLIAECEAVGSMQITDELCDTMSLSVNQVKEIINRAQYSWSKIKEQLPEYKTSKVNFDEDKLNLEIEKGIMEDARRNGG